MIKARVRTGPGPHEVLGELTAHHVPRIGETVHIEHDVKGRSSYRVLDVAYLYTTRGGRRIDDLVPQIVFLTVEPVTP